MPDAIHSLAPRRWPVVLAARVLPAALLALSAALSPRPGAAQAAGGLELRTAPQSTRVYARDGSLLAEIGAPQVRTNVSLKSLPRYLPLAFVAVEDRRFFEHRGVDPVGLARAVKENLTDGFGSQGASTITQQLIGAMYPNTVDRNEKTVERKLKEMQLALGLEERYGKERILEAYLNWIYFGHGWYGIEAAAQHYFGKPAAKLAIEEAAMLAALPKGPGVYSPKIDPTRALERRNLVLELMAQNGVISAADAAAAKRRPIRLAPNHGYGTRPQWAIEQVKQFLAQTYGPGYAAQALRVWTTIDPVAQNAADSALVHGLAGIERLPWYRAPKYGTPAAKATSTGTKYLQGLVVSLDARSGEILALVGGRDWEDSKFNRVTSARRQPGSAFKPLVYAAALQRGVTPATLVFDTALAIHLPGSAVYQPKNSDDLFRGPVTVREGLVQSINTVAIQLGLDVGLETVAAEAKRFGLTTAIPPYPASMIGAGSVRPLELAAAYTAFANRGMRVEPFLVRRVADARGKVLFDRRGKGTRVLSPEVAFLATDLMREAAEKGTGREARQRLPARVPMAGKTGTTNDATDVWYVGFTPEVVTAVWVGFDTPKPIGAGAYGGTLAAPIWGEMMRQLYARRAAPAAWPVPAGVLAVAMDSVPGQMAAAPCPPTLTRREYFLAATIPAGACVAATGGALIGWVPPSALPADSLPADSIPLDSLPLPPDSLWREPPPPAGEGVNG